MRMVRNRPNCMKNARACVNGTDPPESMKMARMRMLRAHGSDGEVRKAAHEPHKNRLILEKRGENEIPTTVHGSETPRKAASLL